MTTPGATAHKRRRVTAIGKLPIDDINEAHRFKGRDWRAFLVACVDGGSRDVTMWRVYLAAVAAVAIDMPELAADPTWVEAVNGSRARGLFDTDPNAVTVAEREAFYLYADLPGAWRADAKTVLAQWVDGAPPAPTIDATSQATTAADGAGASVAGESLADYSGNAAAELAALTMDPLGVVANPPGLGRFPAPTELSAEQMERRRESVGASESAALFGVGYDSPYSLWCKKTEGDSFTGNAATHWGNVHELPILAEFFRRHSDLVPVLQIGTLYHAEAPRVSASPDAVGLLDDTVSADPPPGAYMRGLGSHRGRIVVVQAKSTRLFGDDWGPDGSALIPDRMRIQLHHEACVLESLGFEVVGLHLAALGATSDWRGFEIPIERELLGSIVPKVSAFWGHIDSGEAPPIDGHKATSEALTVPPAEDAGWIDATDRDRIAWEYLEGWKAKADQASEKIEYLRNYFRDRIRDQKGIRGAFGAFAGVRAKGSGSSSRVNWRQVATEAAERAGLTGQEIDAIVTAHTTTGAKVRTIEGARRVK